MIDPIRFFTDKFNITDAQIESLLSTALSKGGAYADLYFEYTVLNSLGLEEQIIKSANRAVRQGVGVRVVSGERTGFAYCDEIEIDSIRKAALTAAHIADSPVEVGPVSVTPGRPELDLYAVSQSLHESSLEWKIERLQSVDKTARAVDPRIRPLACFPSRKPCQTQSWT